MSVAGTGGATSDLHAVRDRDHPHITHHPCHRARLQGNLVDRIQIQLGLWIRIQNLDPSRKAKIVQKTKKNRKKSFLMSWRLLLGIWGFSWSLVIFYGGLERKYCNLYLKNFNFMSTLILHFLVIENLGLSSTGLDPDPYLINTAPNHWKCCMLNTSSPSYQTSLLSLYVFLWCW